MDLKTTIEEICKCEDLETLKAIEKRVDSIQDDEIIRIEKGDLNLKKSLEDTIAQRRRKILVMKDKDENNKKIDVQPVVIERHENQERMGLIEHAIIDIKTKLQTEEFTEDELFHLLLILITAMKAAGSLFDRNISEKKFEFGSKIKGIFVNWDEIKQGGI